MELTGDADEDKEAYVLKIQGELDSLDARMSHLNSLRRETLNHYLDLKGNIRVFCRVRAFLQDERCSHAKSVITTDSSDLLLKVAENKSKRYNFDKVFHPHCTQDEVFSEIEPVIRSALDGYNVCFFAYGQTGTGKTYTMEGKPDCPGIVPRGIEALFRQALESNCEFLFTFSMLEIYMGHLKDLLVHQNRNPRVAKPPCLSIQTDPSGGIEIENLVATTVSDLEQAKRLYKLGSRSRTTASTMSNPTSSRSHCTASSAYQSLVLVHTRDEGKRIRSGWLI